MALTGLRLVRALRPAFQDARHWLPRSKDRAELRRHALKLRFWPGGNLAGQDGGEVMDLDGSWIRSLRGKRVGELRIADTIGGCDNLRLIFFEPDIPSAPLPMIWILSVLQKKRMDFSSAQIRNFNLRRTMVLERFYGRR
jgi:hypothetical protein